MKKSQLNAISRSYTIKGQNDALKEIIARGLNHEYNVSKYNNPLLFIKYYKTPEELEAIRLEKLAKAKIQRLEIKEFGVKTVTELNLAKAKIIEEQIKVKAQKLIEAGILRISKNGNYILIENNHLVYDRDILGMTDNRD